MAWVRSPNPLVCGGDAGRRPSFRPGGAGRREHERRADAHGHGRAGRRHHGEGVGGVPGADGHGAPAVGPRGRCRRELRRRAAEADYTARYATTMDDVLGVVRPDVVAWPRGGPPSTGADASESRRDSVSWLALAARPRACAGAASRLPASADREGHRRRRPRPGVGATPLHIAAGRAGSGPPGGPRPRTCHELSAGARRDVNARDETGVREPLRRRTRPRRPSGGPRDPSATASAAADSVPRGREPPDSIRPGDRRHFQSPPPAGTSSLLSPYTDSKAQSR